MEEFKNYREAMDYIMLSEKDKDTLDDLTYLDDFLSKLDDVSDENKIEVAIKYYKAAKSQRVLALAMLNDFINNYGKKEEKIDSLDVKSGRKSHR